MKVVAIEDVPVEEVPHVREGIFQTQKLLTGQPGTPGNFSLQLVRTPETYYSPRHRHNFAQYRYQLEGSFDFTTDGVMEPGTIAYFPEGTRYGPQDTNSSSLTLVLQFGGDSGSGYLSTEEYQQAAKALEKNGSFSKGVFTIEESGGRKINKDAYEAIWEHVHGRPLVYPQTSYSAPVFVDPDSMEWRESGIEGVKKKLLGNFSKSGIRLCQLKIEKNRELWLEQNCIYFVESGSGGIEEEKYKKFTACFISSSDKALLKADAETCLLQMGLPDLKEY